MLDAVADLDLPRGDLADLDERRNPIPLAAVRPAVARTVRRRTRREWTTRCTRRSL